MSKKYRSKLAISSFTNVYRQFASEDYDIGKGSFVEFNGGNGSSSHARRPRLSPLTPVLFLGWLKNLAGGISRVSTAALSIGKDLTIEQIKLGDFNFVRSFQDRVVAGGFDRVWEYLNVETLLHRPKSRVGAISISTNEVHCLPNSRTK
jgi:hypothetical protein